MNNYRKLQNSISLLKMRVPILVTLIVLITLGFGLNAVFGATWTEVGDAGSLPWTAQVITEAPAGLLKFMHEGNGSGTLAGNPFPASDFVIRAVGDTGDRASHSSGWFIDHSWASISIDGVGDLEFLTGTRTFVNNDTQTVGFSRAGINGVDLFNGPTDAQFATWDMLDPIGPISGLGELLQWTNYTVNTSGGILVFDNGSGDATFTAVPEPATVLLIGLGGLALLRKRRALQTRRT
jgi:hypothetical protein